MIQDCYIPDAFYQLISSQIFVGLMFKAEEELTLFTKKSVYYYHLVTEKFYD